MIENGGDYYIINDNDNNNNYNDDNDEDDEDIQQNEDRCSDPG